MKGVIRQLKLFDYFIIVGIIVLSFIPNIITYSTQQAASHVDSSSNTAATTSTTTTAYIAIVKIDGTEVDRFDLSENAEHTTKTYYPHNGQYNIVERDGPNIRVKEDNSPDQIAVKTGWIHRPGQVSICLPHGLIIEIHGEQVEEPLVLPK